MLVILPLVHILSVGLDGIRRNRGSSIADGSNRCSNRGSSITDGSNRGSKWSSNRLNVDVGFSWDLLMDVRLSRDLYIHIRLSRDLDIHIWLSSNLFMDVGLSSRVKIGIGNRWVIRPSIYSTIDSSVDRGCRETSREGSMKASIASRNTSIGSRETCRVGISSISTRENKLGTGHSQSGEGGNKRLH